MDVAVLVPIKSFGTAKARLEGALSAAQRDQLARWTAGRVLQAAAELPTFVVCDDDVVATWARSRGATILWEVGQGLNAAVDHAVEQIATAGHRHVVVVHGDLPRPAPWSQFARADTVTLVPDRHLDGTNLMSFPVESGIGAAYGAGSFRRHLQRALASTHAVHVVRDTFVGLDIDHPHDLVHPLVQEVLPTWLRTNPANPPSPR